MSGGINILPVDPGAVNAATKTYELTNHLGNVLATISDKGVITSAQDYFPFGLTLASRSFTEGGSSYRFSFNGKEDDKGLKQQDYGMRIYRPDLGRFLSVDPLTKDYPFYTPYQFAGNMPIWAIDLDGLEPFVGNKAYPIQYNSAGDYAQGTMTLLWNSTMGAMGEIMNSTSGVLQNACTKGLYITTAIIITNAEKTSEKVAVETYLYHKNTPLNTQLKDVANSFKDPHNYEFLPTLLGGRLFQYGGRLLPEVKITASRIEPLIEKTAATLAVATKCFIAGTLVTTQKGFVKIEQILVGDSVLTFSEKDNRVVWQKVNHTFSNTTKKLTKLIIGIDTIFSTPIHQFFTNKGWIQAQNLNSNSLVKLASGNWAKVNNIFTFDTITSVYNLEVAINHNYFITKQKLLVHNDCGLAAKIGWKGFRDKKVLQQHYLDHVVNHKEAFGNIERAQYNTKARNLAKETGEHIKETLVGDDYIVKYNTKTGETFIGNSKRKEFLSYRINDGRSATPFEDAVRSAENMWANRQKDK